MGLAGPTRQNGAADVLVWLAYDVGPGCNPGKFANLANDAPMVTSILARVDGSARGYLCLRLFFPRLLLALSLALILGYGSRTAGEWTNMMRWNPLSSRM